MLGDAALLTADEEAELLCVRNQTVLSLARDGSRPGNEVGRIGRSLGSYFIARIIRKPQVGR